MSLILRRALMREIGAWATKPVEKVAGLMICFALVVGALWLTKMLLDAGSIVVLVEQLMSLLPPRLRPVS